MTTKRHVNTLRSPLSRLGLLELGGNSGLGQRLAVEFPEDMQTAQPLSWPLWLCALGMFWIGICWRHPKMLAGLRVHAWKRVIRGLFCVYVCFCLR